MGRSGNPAAASALVPPALTKACPIKNSSIESFVVKGRNLAYNGASFGSVGTYDYILAEATAKVSANDPCAATIVDLKNAADDNALMFHISSTLLLLLQQMQQRPMVL